MTKWLAVSVAVGGMLGWNLGGQGIARADGDPKVAPDSKSSSGVRAISVEELLVTARKRKEKLLDTPVAVTAFSSTDLADLNVRRIQDISNHVPNLALDPTSDTSNAARANLRGVGNGDSIGSDDPGVGLYVDGVYVARAQGALLSLYDLERVEVLRGPQGTLFGKNTIGGTVNLITRKPDLSDFGGKAELRVGNYDLFESRFAVNVPLVPEVAAARISLSTATRDGFIKNKGRGSDLDDEKLLAARAQFRILPSEDLEVNLSLEHSIEDRKPQGFKCKVVNPFPAGTNAVTRPDLATTGTAFRSAPTSALLAQQSGVNNLAQQAANLLTGANPFLDACADDANRDTRSVASEVTFQEEDLKTFGSNATLTWDVSDQLTFKAISGWRRQELDQSRDFDATELPILAINSIDAGLQQQDELSQEFQLLGNGFDGRLSYVVGLFGLLDKNNSRGYLGQNSDTTFLFPVSIANPTVLVPQRGSLVTTRLKVDNVTYAAYAQGSYELTEQLSLSAGVRVTQERKEILRDDTCETMGVLCPSVGFQPVLFDGSTRSKNLSPVATIQYEPSENTRVYASWSRAFKSGGFNGRLDSPTLTNTIDDEQLTSYEVGFKGSLLDRRLLVSAVAFHSIYEDIQLSLTRPNPLTGLNQTFVTNAGRAEISGGELELRWALLQGLEFNTALGATHARYTEFDAPATSVDPRIPDDPKDRALPNTPTYTMNFGLSYQRGLGRLGDIRLRGDWTHIGRSGTDPMDSRELRKGKHGELDAQMVWALPDGATEFVLFADNLLDREYVTNGINLGASFGHALLLYNEPRTYGFELRRNF